MSSTAADSGFRKDPETVAEIQNVATILFAGSSRITNNLGPETSFAVHFQDGTTTGYVKDKGQLLVEGGQVLVYILLTGDIRGQYKPAKSGMVAKDVDCNFEMPGGNLQLAFSGGPIGFDRA